MADKTLTYVDTKVMFSIKITLHFDDQSFQEKTYSIGDKIFIDYIQNRELVSVQGTLKQLISGGKMLVIDASTEGSSLVANVCVDDIKKLHDILTVHGTITSVDGVTPVPIISENNAIFTGSIPYVIGTTEGNFVIVKINAPEGIAVTAPISRVEGGTSTFDATTGQYKCTVTKIDEVFKLYIKWNTETIEEVFNVIIADAVLEPKPIV